MAESRTRNRRRVSASAEVTLDFAFFNQLIRFLSDNRREIRRSYKDLTKKYLAYNDPSRPGSFLRLPQFEALEIYVFLKEFAQNAHIQELFDAWYKKGGLFEQRANVEKVPGQLSLEDAITEEQYRAVMAKMKANKRSYPNYIFALTMGTGKTLLMGTCIFYEFLLANKYPEDSAYCHNALIFAPDKTVLQSLRELEGFDLAKVVPPEYAPFLTSHLQFHFLDEAGTSLCVLDRSRFNIIVSNTQKIILKRQHQEKSPVDQLFSTGKTVHKVATAYDEISDLYVSDQPEDEEELVSNQRFEKLKRLEQLGIYVDEAHHAFGERLAKDMGIKHSDTSLRVTIDELATALSKAGTRVVACFNYTGTPYVGREVLPEVVYAYGLKEAIDNGYLKKVDLSGYSNVKRTNEFVRLGVDDFLDKLKNKRFEGMIPKLAFFGSTIEELVKDVKPALERALEKHDISPDRILVNVGDDKHTTNDDIREFNRLDTPESKKQFILLVNKGREGWNCRSLFGVALHREPKSKIFVLQATMRCLRSIGSGQQTGYVYLSEDNIRILDNELQQNFRISTEEFKDAGKKKLTVKVRPVPPPVKIKLRRVHRSYTIREKQLKTGVTLGLSDIDKEKYRMIKTTKESFKGEKSDLVPDKTEDVSHYKEQTEFTELSLVAEVARYLNKSPVLIDEILSATKEGLTTIVREVNQFNEILYEHVIPKLFSELYDLEPKESIEDHDVELIKQPPADPGCYEVLAAPEMVVGRDNPEVGKLAEKSFHLDNYCFDSTPERTFFWNLLRESRVKKVWFTGMLTHGQTDFSIQYIDPETHSLRSYYPDFIYVDENEVYNIVEVKGDDQFDDPTVLAKKEFAEQMAAVSGMTYKMVKGSEAMHGGWRKIFE